VRDACADRGWARHNAALSLYENYLYEVVASHDLCRLWRRGLTDCSGEEGASAHKERLVGRSVASTVATTTSTTATPSYGSTKFGFGGVCHIASPLSDTSSTNVAAAAAAAAADRTTFGDGLLNDDGDNDKTVAHSDFLSERTPPYTIITDDVSGIARYTSFWIRLDPEYNEPETQALVDYDATTQSGFHVWMTTTMAGI